jgi:hypothetical protein
VAVEVPDLDAVLAVLEHDLDEGPVVRVYDGRLAPHGLLPSGGGASGMPPSRNTTLMLK